MKPLLMVSVHNTSLYQNFITGNHSKFGKELQLEHIRDADRTLKRLDSTDGSVFLSNLLVLNKTIINSS